jgi:hypothetical protein|tara:strand:+ start:758 stop:1018 length:261 start_codon:yes stop_codon:yes gene_type:complete
MDEKPSFGEIAANNLKVGDIVEWSKWNSEMSDWESNYGVIMEVKNEIKGNRLVSVSIVVPLSGPGPEMEFFTPSLRLVSKAESVGE